MTQHTLAAAISSLSTLCVLRLIGDAAYLPDDAEELSRLSGVHEHVARVQLLSGVMTTLIHVVGISS